VGIYGSLRKLEAFLLESQALLRDCVSSETYGALLREYRALLRDYRVLLREYRVLLWEYMAL